MSGQTRAGYAATLASLSAGIVAAVRDEGPAAVQKAIDVALAVPPAPGVDPTTALIVVLAAQIDPELGWQDTLGWVLGLNGTPGPAPRTEVSMAHLADVHALTCGKANPASVPVEARREAVRQLIRQGLTGEETAERTGINLRSVERYRAQLSDQRIGRRARTRERAHVA